MDDLTILNFKIISFYNNKLNVLCMDEKTLLYMYVLVKFSDAEK